MNFGDKVCHEGPLRFLHRKTRSRPESVGVVLGVLVVDGILWEKDIAGFEDHLARKFAVQEYEYWESECGCLEAFLNLECRMRSVTARKPLNP